MAWTPNFTEIRAIGIGGAGYGDKPSVDITDAVALLVAHLRLYSEDDYEEPLLSIAEAQTLLEFVQLCGFADAEHSLRDYITDRNEAAARQAQAVAEQTERNAFLRSLPSGMLTDVEIPVEAISTRSTMVCSTGPPPRKPVKHQHHYSTFGNCLWPWCSAKQRTGK